MEFTFMITDAATAIRMLRAQQGKVTPFCDDPFTHLISIRGFNSLYPRDHDIAESNCLFQEFLDTEDLEEHGPQEAHVEQLIEFARRLPSRTDLLLHCHAGISRSTAAAMIVLAAREPQAKNHDILHRVLNRRPQADPNQVMLMYADTLLGRDSRKIGCSLKTVAVYLREKKKLDAKLERV